MTLVTFAGGPQDGLVANVSGRQPCFLLNDPRPLQLWDGKVPVATWNEDGQCYELREES